MDIYIVYFLVGFALVVGTLIYRDSQAETEPLWSKAYEPPYRKPLGQTLRESETWLFATALAIALAIVTT